MKGYFTNIEGETKRSQDYRRVLYTANHSQLVLMRLQPKEEIGEETHGVDQFLRFESGKGKVIINGNEYTVADGDAVIVPAGAKHNVINTSADAPLALYTIYSPPEHKNDTVHKTKTDEAAEHFDGITSE